MKQDVVLSLSSEQIYMDQEPDVIELVTDGVLEKEADDWRISYEESELTGLAGAQTTFLLKDDSVTLIRSGSLNSTMHFREGVSHESLYQMEFGAMLITVCASKIAWDLTPQGGTVDLCYFIDVEHSASGTVNYHLQIRAK